MPESYSDLEVDDKWLKVFPGKLNNPKVKTQRDLIMQAIIKDPDLLAVYRERLGSLSWLMRRVYKMTVSNVLCIIMVPCAIERCEPSFTW